MPPANVVSASHRQRALLGACVAALALVFAPPFLIAAGWPYAELLHWLAHPVCHQIAERSFHFMAEPMAVCQRCTGIYVGFALGVALWPHLPSAARWLADHPRALVFFLLPVGIDWALDGTAASRFATGAIASFPAALPVLMALDCVGGKRPLPAAAKKGPANPSSSFQEESK